MAFDPFGKLMQAQILSRKLGMQERSQDIQNRMALAQLAQAEEESRARESGTNALMSLFSPQQSGGPVMGETYQPLEFNTPEVGRGDIFSALLQAGDVDRAMQFAPQTRNPEYDIRKSATGEFVYLPKTPGQAIGSGIMGETGKTDEIKEFEYAVKNPQFLLRKREKEQRDIEKELRKQRFSDASDLRNEFIKSAKDFEKVRDSYMRVEQSTQDPSPAGDLSLIFNYMKMLDPGSVVRESEFATAAATGSYGERLKAAANKILAGERLSDSMRNDFLEKSKSLYDGMVGQHKKREKTYTSLAKRNNIPINDVVIDLSKAESNLPPVITTQEEYDNLPSGAIYTEDGKKYRKP